MDHRLVRLRPSTIFLESTLVYALFLGVVASAFLSARPAEAQSASSDSSMSSVEQTCNGMLATVYVSSGVIVGGPMDGTSYYGILRGTDEDDVIVGTNKQDIIGAKAGNDTVCGGSGNDLIYGDNGNDWLNGENGNDLVLGGNGDDTLAGGNGENFFDGGMGTNMCHVTSSRNITLRCQGTN